MSLVHNERTKLMATFFNTLASGSIIAGVVAPAAGFLFRVQGLAELSFAFLAGSAAIWLSSELPYISWREACSGD